MTLLVYTSLTKDHLHFGARVQQQAEISFFNNIRKNSSPLHLYFEYFFEREARMK